MCSLSHSSTVKLRSSSTANSGGTFIRLTGIPTLFSFRDLPWLFHPWKIGPYIHSCKAVGLENFHGGWCRLRVLQETNMSHTSTIKLWSWWTADSGRAFSGLTTFSRHFGLHDLECLCYFTHAWWVLTYTLISLSVLRIFNCFWWLVWVISASWS